MISSGRSRARIGLMLIFIRMLYKGKSVPENTSQLGILKKLGYLCPDIGTGNETHHIKGDELKMYKKDPKRLEHWMATMF